MIRKAIFLVLLLAGGMTIASAGTTTPDGCDKAPPRDERVAPGVSLETAPGQYFYLPKTAEEMNKAGFWSETGQREGLQTSPCMRYTVLKVYDADHHDGAAVP